jgi:hypothetical protein
VVIRTLNAPGSRIRNVLPVGSSGPILPDPNPLNSGFIPGSSPFASLFTFRLPVLVLYLKLCDGLFPATFYFPADDNVLRLQSGEVRYLVIVCFFWGGHTDVHSVSVTGQFSFQGKPHWCGTAYKGSPCVAGPVTTRSFCLPVLSRLFFLKNEYYSSRGLKTPFFALRILHSGHRQVSGTLSHGVPGGMPFLGSPLSGS